MRTVRVIVAITVAPLVAPTARAQRPETAAAPEALLDRMTGHWVLTGTIGRKPTTLLTAAVNSTVVADENLTVGSMVWLPAERLAPGR